VLIISTQSAISGWGYIPLNLSIPLGSGTRIKHNVSLDMTSVSAKWHANLSNVQAVCTNVTQMTG